MNPISTIKNLHRYSTRDAVTVIVTMALAMGGLSLEAQDDLPFSSGSNGTDGALVIPVALSSRYFHAAAYDELNDETVVFGGFTNTYLADTWTFDGTTWSPRTPVASPPARRNHAMAYDAARGEVVLFGGFNGSSRMNDTWVWKDGTWTNKSPVLSPTPREGTAMAYDPLRQEVVLFGGYNGSYINDTWVWNGTLWTQKTPSTSPATRSEHAMCWNGKNSRIFMYGGYNGRSDTWGWDGSEWSIISSAIAPPGRQDHSMAYDPVNEVVVMRGGSNNANYRGTWVFEDGVGWSEVFPLLYPFEIQPRNFYHSAMVYHGGSLNRILHIAGFLRDSNYTRVTYAFDGTNWNHVIGGNYYIDMRDNLTGIYNFTTIDVPANVTVIFTKNAANTPVVWLATGNVTIDGVVNVSGQNGFATTLDLEVAEGGPGGFDGGLGGIAFNNSGSYAGSPGQGPGGGTAGTSPFDNSLDSGGWGTHYNTYGNNFIIPLIGGSGGGGTPSIETENGSGGGGGGGAILIASSRDIILNGEIRAKGGNRIYDNSGTIDDYSGIGSGGAVKLVADRLLGTGFIDVRGGDNNGGVHLGRIRLEAYERPLENNAHTNEPSSSSPVAENFAAFLASQPSLSISSVDGEAVSQPPSGSTATPDVVFSNGGTVNVVVEGSNVPDGTSITVTVNFAGGSVSLPTAGTATMTGGTAIVSGVIPSGVGTLEAFAQFTAN
ncbi:MAG: kelch repeat-containing protein [Puniceicoccaceae bacterium]